MRPLVAATAAVVFAACGAKPPPPAAHARVAAPSERTLADDKRAGEVDPSWPPDLIACEKGDLPRCFDAVDRLRSLGSVRSAARTRWESGCQDDDARDCYRLALLVDTAERMPPLERACDLQLMEGCQLLGVIYEAGEPAEPELGPAAAALYARACDGAFAEGCLSLASRLDHTGASGDDRARALVLFDRACALDAKIGCERAQELRCELGTGKDCGR
jgi:TPR repeat protein